MGNRHQEQVFHRAWTGHQQIRLLLAEIEVVLKQFGEAQSEWVHVASGVTPGPLRQKLSGLGDELRRSFAIEGADGDVAITLACDRRLDAEVSALTSRRKRLEQAVSHFVEAFTSADATSTQVTRLSTTFSELSGSLTSYLGDKMDALRRSLITSSRSAVLTC